MDMDIVHRFRPIVWLHGDEDFFPIGVEEYLSHCALCRKGSNKVLISEGGLSFDNLPLDDKSHEYRLVPNQTTLGRRKFNLQTIPMYARHFEKEDGSKVITYIFFYAFDGGVKFLCKNLDTHDADWEHIKMYISADSEIEYVVFSRHGDDKRVNVESLEIEDGHVVVYSSLGKHASYNSEGRNRRYLIFTEPTGKGLKWDSDNIVLIDGESPIYRYLGWWGSKGIEGLR